MLIYPYEHETAILNSLFAYDILIHVGNQYECTELLKIFARHNLNYHYGTPNTNSSITAKDAEDFKIPLCYGIITHPIKKYCVQRFAQNDFHNDFKFVIEFNELFKDDTKEDKNLTKATYNEFTIDRNQFWHITSGLTGNLPSF